MAFLIRFVHVGAASLLLGGALLIFVFILMNRRGEPRADGSAILQLMAAYEWVFWLSVAALAITGIGNLARFGEALPGPDTEWGTTLLVKLALVIVFLLLSAVRSSSLVLIRRLGDMGSRKYEALGRLYGATTVFIACIAGLTFGHPYS